MDDKEISAQESIKKLLDALGIQRVICVDDIYAKVPIEEALVAQSILSPEKLVSIMPEISMGQTNDADVRREAIRRTLSSLEPSLARQRIDTLKSAAPQDVFNAKQDDDAHAITLKNLIGASALVMLSPSEWSKRQGDILKEAIERPTLLLFDQDLTEDGGSKTGGTIIISTLLARNDDKILCGLLTHTLTTENQYSEWEKLARDNNLDKDRFLVIPKDCLDKNPLGFAHMLKLIALSSDFKKMKKQAKEILAEAHQKAEIKVEGISVLDFDHIVFHVPSREGNWEPEMLFRLFTLYHRLEARALAHTHPALEDTVKKLRTLCDIPTDAEMAVPPNSWAIQHIELYESGEYVNRYHLPIDLGDIFEKTEQESRKTYILLSQPCDLMVRANGKRHPELKYVVLAEISQVDTMREYQCKLPYYGDDPSKLYVVKLKSVHHIDPIIIDMCVFSSDGSATFDVNQSCPTGIRPAWVNRFKILKKELLTCVEKHDLIQPERLDHAQTAQLKAVLRRQHPRGFLHSEPFKGDIVTENDQKSVKYNLRRVSRLIRPRATALLADFSLCSCRPAFDPEFGSFEIHD
jgi:hypothetical protein